MALIRLIKEIIGYCLSYIFMWIGDRCGWLDDRYDNDCEWTFRLYNWFYIVSDRFQEFGGGYGPWKFAKISKEELDKHN